jgi:hypothetical protein
MSRGLRQLRVVALLIDGVHFGEHVVPAAVGVDEHGDKHVLLRPLRVRPYRTKYSVRSVISARVLKILHISD